MNKGSETQTFEQSSNKTQYTGKKESNGRNDLEERFAEQGPERVQLLLGMRHICNALAGVVNGLDDCLGEFFEDVRELVVFGSGIVLGSSCFGGCGDAAIRVKSADGSVAFLKHAAAFFDQGLDFLDELFFVELFLWCAVGFLDVLQMED